MLHCLIKQKQLKVILIYDNPLISIIKLTAGGDVGRASTCRRHRGCTGRAARRVLPGAVRPHTARLTHVIRWIDEVPRRTI